MSNYLENADNVKPIDQIALWTLDESKLSEDDKYAMKIVSFPKKIGYQHSAMKRITKGEFNNSYRPKDVLTINDIRYLIVPKKTAIYNIALSTPTGDTQAEIDASLNKINLIAASKKLMHLFIDANYMEAELAWFLSKFSVPKSTPSMIGSPVEGSTENDSEDAEKPITGNPKGILSDAEKEEIKKMSAEKFSAKEISEGIGKFKTTIVAYLKTIEKE